MRIFVVERHTAATFAAVYRFDVGSAQDPKGKSGLAHLVEHMMFHGTQTLGAIDAEKENRLATRLDTLWGAVEHEHDRAQRASGSPDAARLSSLKTEIATVTKEYRTVVASGDYQALLSRLGSVGQNAHTNHDATTYVTELPRNRLQLWFRLEADRIQHPVFRDYYTERDVVREERRRNHEGSASALMYQALRSMLFSAHPYGTPIIGWPGDIDHLQREDAVAFYRAHYTPSRCSLVLVGDVDPKEVESLAKQYFGGWQASPVTSAPPHHLTPEPETNGEQRRVIEFDAAPAIWLAWPTVPEYHADEAPLDVLSVVLGAMSHDRLSRGFGGGRASHQVLPGAGYFVAFAGSANARWVAGYQESRIERAIRAIQKHGITDAKLARAKHILQSGSWPGLEGNMALAGRIASAVRDGGSAKTIDEYPDRVERVTAEQVRAAARRYLLPQRKCVIELRRPPKTKDAAKAQDASKSNSKSKKAAPAVAAVTDRKPASETKSEPARESLRPGEVESQDDRHSPAFTATVAELPGSPPLEALGPELGRDVERIVLPSGITLYVKEDHTQPKVTLDFSWRGGVNSSPLSDLDAHPMTSGLLSYSGTSKLSAEDLSEKKHELGMSFSVSVGGTTSSASFFAPSKNFAPAYDLAMDVLMHPRIGEIDTWVRKYGVARSLRSRSESLDRGAWHLMEHVLHHDHPRLGYLPSKSRFMLTTWPFHVRRLWRRYLGRDNLYIAAVGDFDKRELIDRIERTLGTWRRAEDSSQVFLARPLAVRKGAYLVRKALPGAAIVLAQELPIDRTAPESEHAALTVLASLLGTSGFNAALLRRLRVVEGLTYAIGMQLVHQGEAGVPGVFRVAYETKTGSVYRSLTCALEEIERLRKTEVTQAVLDQHLDRWRNQRPFQYASSIRNVERLVSHELHRRPWDYDRTSWQARLAVTPADVLRVAKKYLQPEQLTIAIYGTLSAEEEAQIRTRFGLKILSKQEVFTGGYN